MRNFALTLVAFSLVALSQPCAAQQYEGVDKTVVEKAATQAGRPPSEPVINTDKGDLLLFMFLCAGTVGGFVMGYTFRGLFGKGERAAGGDKGNSGGAGSA